MITAELTHEEGGRRKLCGLKGEAQGQGIVAHTQGKSSVRHTGKAGQAETMLAKSEARN